MHKYNSVVRWLPLFRLLWNGFGIQSDRRAIKTDANSGRFCLSNAHSNVGVLLTVEETLSWNIIYYFKNKIRKLQFYPLRTSVNEDRW